MALEKNVVKKLEQNIQNEQILKAKLNNLESCPHCTYAVIMENPFEKITWIGYDYSDIDLDPSLMRIDYPQVQTIQNYEY